jgi:hypothetical protein
MESLLPLTVQEQDWLECLKLCVAYRKRLDHHMGAAGVFSYAQEEARIAELQQRSAV